MMADLVEGSVRHQAVRVTLTPLRAEFNHLLHIRRCLGHCRVRAGWLRSSCRGAWQAIGPIAPERLSSLRRVGAIESIGSSTRIEGGRLSDRGVAQLLTNLDVRSFASLGEQEVAAHADVMETIFAHQAEAAPGREVRARAGPARHAAGAVGADPGVVSRAWPGHSGRGRQGNRNQPATRSSTISPSLRNKAT